MNKKLIRNAFEKMQNFKVELIVPFVSRVGKLELALDFELFRDG